MVASNLRFVQEVLFLDFPPAAMLQRPNLLQVHHALFMRKYQVDDCFCISNSIWLLVLSNHYYPHRVWSTYQQLERAKQWNVYACYLLDFSIRCGESVTQNLLGKYCGGIGDGEGRRLETPITNDRSS